MLYLATSIFGFIIGVFIMWFLYRKKATGVFPVTFVITFAIFLVVILLVTLFLWIELPNESDWIDYAGEIIGAVTGSLIAASISYYVTVGTQTNLDRQKAINHYILDWQLNNKKDLYNDFKNSEPTISEIVADGNELTTLFAETNEDMQISNTKIRNINLNLSTNLASFKNQLAIIDDKYKPTFDFVTKMSYKGQSIQDCLDVINHDLDNLASFENSLATLLQTYQNDNAFQTSSLYKQAKLDFENVKDSFQLEKPFTEMLTILIEFPN